MKSNIDLIESSVSSHDFEFPGREIIARYSAQLPRYTSYPTAVEFTGDFAEEPWRAELNRQINASSSAPLAIYSHLPFCRSLCYFCACNKTIARDRSQVAPYLAAIKEEVMRYSRLFPEPPPIAQLHWGGGSPNFLTPEEMIDLHSCIKTQFPRVVDEPDLSIELDPRTTTGEQLIVLRELGFNRVSLGVQDFDEQVQRAVNRIQSLEQTAELVSSVRRLGFGGINLDLIYGLPLQTPASFEQTITRVCQMRPDRIALYGYAHVTWIKKTQRVFDKLPLPSPTERLTLFTCAMQMLLASGYQYIGMDHFALPGDSLTRAMRNGTLNRNFMGYTACPSEALIATGVSAISAIPGAFAQNERILERYIKRVANGELPVERGVACSLDDRRRSSLIKLVMCQGRINLKEFERDWGLSSPLELCQVEELNSLQDDGLLELNSEAINVTPLGRFFLRNIAAKFDGYLVGHAGKQRFSQSV